MSEATDTSPMISVIVPTRNRAEDLARSLPAVLTIDYPEFEVIVVDQSTTDATERAVSSAVSAAVDQGCQWKLVVASDEASEVAEHPPEAGERRLTYVRTATVGVSRSLNLGVRRAQGDVMAFTPDDCTVPPNWLSLAAAVLAREPDAGLVFGAVTKEAHDWNQAFVPTFLPTHYRRLKGRLGYLQFHGVMGANMVVRRAVFERLGGVDECLGTGCRFRSFEDVDLGYRALRAGFAVILDPNNAVVHWGEREFTDGSAQRLIRNGRYGYGACFIKHLRSGDFVAGFILLRGTYGELKYTIANAVMRRQLTGAGRLLHIALGVLAGSRQPLDHRRWIYLP